MNKEIIIQSIENNGLSYEKFNIMSEKYLESAIPEELNETEKKHLEYTKLNVHRTNRIHKTYKPNEEIINLINAISSPQTWLVLTEAWCGDSAQNIPYLSVLSKINPLIKLVILERDSNPEVMDMFLTNGTARSIPKVIAFDENSDILFQWGPRPKEAKELVLKLKEEGFSKEEFNEKLHLWYGRNRGKNLEAEFMELLETKLEAVNE